jgi:predicted transcriptional regulator
LTESVKRRIREHYRKEAHMRAIELLRVVLGADLDMSDRFALMGIIFSCSWETWSGSISIKQIAGTANISSATVKRSLASLTEKGLIVRERVQSRFGEVSGLIRVMTEKINDFAVAQREHTLAQPEPPLAQPEPPLAQPEPPLAQPEPSMAQPDTSEAQPEPPISVLPVLPVHQSVSTVLSPVQQSASRPASPSSETPRETREPERPWRTLPPKTNAWTLSKQYYSLLRGLGHHTGLLQLQNALAQEKVYPDLDDVHSFLMAHSHLID